MSLVSSIDAAVEYVRAHSDFMSEAQVEEFRSLAERVYLQSFRAGIADAIPKVPELRPEVESSDPPLPPVQFETKLNLPGDWDNGPIRDDDEPLPFGIQRNADGTFRPDAKVSRQAMAAFLMRLDPLV